MLTLDATAVAEALPYDQLIDALATAFGGEFEVPLRAHHEVLLADGNPGTLLLMPAWQSGGSMGVKIATVFPDNAAQGYPSVFATYILMSGQTGMPIAVLDGAEITLRRTAAASALASTWLSRSNSTKLLMVGTGNLAPYLIAAHVTARPITELCIWGRRKEAAGKLAATLATSSFSVTLSDDLEEAVSRADIISCATLAIDPLIRGAWLKSGQHLDLVGSFKQDMREADSEAVSRADVYVDTRAGTMSEAGEIVHAVNDGSFHASDIKGELRDLVTGNAGGRISDKSITLFKSVGTALEDLAAAELAVKNYLRDA
ncbi:MAG: ornithine cyclodeaminase family protein [Gammaproteobacteria bacterium]|nr:MAG: ornithine cyclodeaminase family protein [Gammaproteobacteria bacterium]